MVFKVTTESVLAFTKANVSLVCSWPPTSNAKRSEILRFRIYWWIALFLLVQLFLPLINGIWVFRNDLVIAVKLILLSSATSQALAKIIFCRLQRKRLQILYTELETFLKSTKPFERLILQRYVDRVIIFYGLVSVGIYLACLNFILEPLIISQPFPTDASYPFPVHFHPVYEILYIQQSVAICHIGCAIFIDSQLATLLWFAAARFEMLGEEFERVSSPEEFNACIRKHQELLRFANEATFVSRFIALAIIATATVGLLCGGLTLMSRQPISVKIRVSNLIINATVELFLYAWPADNLIAMSEDIGNRVYRSAWVGKPNAMLKNIVCVLHRSQKPVIVSVRGFVPVLSLYYYLSFLSTSLSYFMTLRIVYTALPDSE